MTPRSASTWASRRANSRRQKNPEAQQRLPVGNLWQQDAQGNVDFEYQDGVMFLNSDDSYSLIFEDGDTKTRYQMRRVMPKQPPRRQP